MPFESAYFIISSLNNKQEIKGIKKQLDTLPGVRSVSVNPENNRVAVDFDNTGVTRRQIKNKLHDTGFMITEEN
ncbi:MAG: hypothetical protein K0S55_2163 [Clostridia bacterium]|nr:hypothetical protein [Clostridia bacterium]